MKKQEDKSMKGKGIQKLSLFAILMMIIQMQDVACQDKIKCPKFTCDDPYSELNVNMN